LPNKSEKKPNLPAQPAETSTGNSELDDFFRSLKEGKLNKPDGSDPIAAAMDAAQKFAAEQDAEDAVRGLSRDPAADSGGIACKVCGYRNREGNKFCGSCGSALGAADKGASQRTEAPQTHTPTFLAPPDPYADPVNRPATTRPTGNETHHYHHHYHHHYFQGAQDGAYPRTAEPMRDPAREEKIRSTTMALRGDLNRSEAAVRAITHEWVLACNTKHLDDLLELYLPDALVMRSNYPPIRGAAAVREFFFSALDAGLGEVEIEPLRVDVAGDMAYEGGRFKALIPSSTGKRREERGKYLWVLQKQANGEWRVAADCWSSDLTLGMLESDVPATGGVKTTPARK
jgi:ketosteroid isomerase-like protein